MKAKVIKEFIDKNTRERYSVWEIITVSKDRFAEILTKGNLVEEVIEPKKEPKKTTKKSAK